MDEKDKALYIIGAGFAGQMLFSDIKRKKIMGHVAAFLDDDPKLIGTIIEDVPVIGPIDKTIPLLRFRKFDEAIISTPSASIKRVKEIYEELKKAGAIKIKILPNISQVISGEAHLIQTRDIDMLDILGREPVSIPLKEALNYLRGMRVLVTGAGGSIGSELCRQLLSGGAERLYLLGNDEYSIYEINRELKALQAEGVGEKASIVPIIGDVGDKDFISYIIKKTKTSVIFHTAAYKQVPLMEENPIECIKNNVFATKNLLEVCLKEKIKRFVFISTDKAVSPISIYGASKLLGEHLVLQAAAMAGRQGEASFMFVRFANVLGSRGSILPLFMQEIRIGGPITVTTPNMERYFMTIPEACSLVLQVGGVGENGESYLLDMGAPIKILYLAEQLIKFFALRPYEDIDIKFIGTRAGERESEPLLSKCEQAIKTKYKRILRIEGKKIEGKKLEDLLIKLKEVCYLSKKEEERSVHYRDKEYLRAIIMEYVKEY